MWSSLTIPNYRSYALGQFISSVGMWMANTAQIWLVMVTLGNNKAVNIGWLSAAVFGPAILLFPYVGRAADKFSKRTILLITQVIRTLAMLALAVLTLTGHITLSWVFFLAFVDGTASAFDGPARQAFINEIVPNARIANAISLNSMAFNSARLIGPAVAGILMARANIGWVFLIAAVLFLGFVIGLLALDLSHVYRTGVTQADDASLLGGLRYVRRRPDLVLIMATAFVIGTFMFNFAMTNPMMAKLVFHKAESEYGVLQSILAIGALAGAIYSARRAYPRLRHIIVSLAGFIVASILMATAPTFELFALWLIPTALFVLLATITCNQLIQLRTGDAVRGRVMALYMAIFLGGTPLFSPLLGRFGDLVGARWTIATGTLAAAIMLVIFVGYTMGSEGMRLRYDADARRRFRLSRGRVTIGMPEQEKR